MTDSRKPKLVVIAHPIHRDQFKQLADDDSFQFDFREISARPINSADDPDRLQKILAELEKNFPEDFNPAFVTKEQILELKLKCVATVMVCNALFVAAHSCSTENEAWQNEFSLSVMLPITIGFFDFVWRKNITSLGIGVLGGTTGLIASMFNQAGAPLWVAPAVGIPAIVSACIENKKIDGLVSKTYEKTAEVLNNGVNNLFNFWRQRIQKKSETQQIKPIENDDKEVIFSSERRFGR